MSPAARGASPRRRLGTILFCIGLLAVLGGTFVIGALAGRLSLRPSASLANAPKAADRGAKATTPEQPELTFYRELTAPLSAPPPAPKPQPRAAKRETPTPAAAPRPSATPPEPARARDAHGSPATNAAPSAGGGPYTVQVGAYNARAQAEAVRARLATAGHEAYVTEGETPSGTRYRVRIGAFATAADARQAAARIGTQAHVPTYVTTR